MAIKLNQIDLPKFTVHGILLLIAMMSVMILAVALRPPKVYVIEPDELLPLLNKVSRQIDELERQHAIHIETHDDNTRPNQPGTE